MLTLRELLNRHDTVLVVDSASSCIQIGLLQSGQPPFWNSSTDEAGCAIFACTQDVLTRAQRKLSQVDALVFCEGPGSILGIRTAAVALRTWAVLKPRPAYAYGSLELLALHQRRERPGEAFSAVADARRDTWHRIAVDAAGTLGALERVKPDQLGGILLLPEHFRHWAALPSGVQTVPYSVPSMLHVVDTTPLFREAPEPDAFLHEEPAYQTWTPQIHRAPS